MSAYAIQPESSAMKYNECPNCGTRWTPPELGCPKCQDAATPAPAPRTDGFIASHLAAWPQWDWQDHASVYADFARTLERELLSAQAALTSAQAALAAKDAEIADLTSALSIANRSADEQMRYKREAEARAEKAEAQLDSVCYGRQKEAEQYREVLMRLTERAEKAEAERDALRTLWTEARVVVAQCRDANCLASYGKAQCDAVAAANKWLDKMPSALRERRTIDDASNAEWELVRVTQERAQLRARVAELEQDKARLDWLDSYDSDSYWNDYANPGQRGKLRAAIDAAREGRT